MSSGLATDAMALGEVLTAASTSAASTSGTSTSAASTSGAAASGPGAGPSGGAAVTGPLAGESAGATVAGRVAGPVAGGRDFSSGPISGDTSDAERRSPGRPRSAKADEAIIEAVLDLLAEGSSVEALSIEAVANRAGVGKATIYRRWPNKEALVVDAVAVLKGPPAEIAGESVRDDLLALLRPIGQSSQTRVGRIYPCLISEVRRNPELGRYYQKLMEPRRARMRSVLERGIGAGELKADIDIDYVCAILTGPIVAHAVLNWNPSLSGQKLAESTVDMVLVAISA